MKSMVTALALMCFVLVACPVSADVRPVEEKQEKPTAARVKGMEKAVRDIKKGHLKRLESLLPAAQWREDYLHLLAKECGVAIVHYRGLERDEVEGYNDVMNAEIERRFGKGIFEQLQKKALAEFLKDVPLLYPSTFER